MAGMGERGSCSSKVPLFPLLFVGLAMAVIITMISLSPETRKMSPVSPMLPDGRLLGQNNKSVRQKAEDVELSPTVAKELQVVKDMASLADVEDDSGNEQNTDHNVGSASAADGPTELDILEAYRIWDSTVGCVVFQGKIRAEQHRNSSFRSLQPEDSVRCADLQKLHVSVLVKEWTWIPDSLNGFHTCSCGLTCLWTKSQMVADDPDVHFYEGSRPPFQRKQGDPLRAYVEMEADQPRTYQEDIFVGYHAKAHVQATYAGNSLAQNRNHYISPRKRSDILVYWSSSRCLSERQSIASSFLPLISHHSFGKCLNNVGRRPDQDQDPLFEMYPECKTDGGDKDWTHHIHCAMSHYMFALAIENTMTESYVTEKLFYALDVGTVPIYFGASNVMDLVPPNSIIQASKFSSTQELVAYVKEVAQDPVQYAEFHAWRRCGELGNYRHTWSMGFDTLPCRLCATVSKLGGKITPAAIGCEKQPEGIHSKTHGGSISLSESLEYSWTDMTPNQLHLGIDLSNSECQTRC